MLLRRSFRWLVLAMLARAAPGARNDAWPRWSCARLGRENSCGNGARAAAGRSARSSRPSWPRRLPQRSGNVLRCGEAGLSGALSIEGVGERYSAALVKVFWRDGQSRVYTLHRASTHSAAVRVGGRQARHGRDRARVPRARRRAHPERLRSPAVRARVAVSRWVSTQARLDDHGVHARAQSHACQCRARLAHAAFAAGRGDDRVVDRAGGREALQTRETLARRLPALVAFLFGLVHGLGFAGALSEIGLPQNHLATALLTFNVGVEIGQLMTVVLAWLVWLMLRRWKFAARGRVPLLYGMGSIAAYWSWLRIAAMVG